MRTVPTLVPCPGCSILLQEGEGPYGLAFHGCDTMAAAAAERTPRDLIAEVAIKEDLTVGEAGRATLRFALAEMAEGGGVSVRDAADLLKAVAEMEAAGGGGGVDEALAAFMSAPEEDGDDEAAP